MNMNKIITLLLANICLFATGCKIEEEYIYTTKLTFKNESAHKIKINIGSESSLAETSWSCAVMPDEHYSRTIDNGSIWWVMEDGCIVIFDDEIVVDHRNTTIEHNLCCESSYTVKVSGRHDTEITYTYIFTDEDYDRAVAANKENEE